MNLQEILESFSLSAEQITQINSAVDGVIESKLSGQTEQIKELEDNLTKTQGDLDAANNELTPVRNAAKTEKLTSLMPDNADLDKQEDIVTLAKIADDDDDETITKKLSDVVSSKDYLQKGTTDDAAAANKSSENFKVDKKDTEKKNVMPQGVK